MRFQLLSRRLPRSYCSPLRPAAPASPGPGEAGAARLVLCRGPAAAPCRPRDRGRSFLPADKKQRAQILEELQDETRTIILYEAPHHLVKTLEELFKTLGSRKVRICRELTKKHETVYADTLDGALAHYRDIEEPRGECVIIIEGADREDLNKQKQQSWEEMTIEEHMALYEDMNRKDAMKQVAKDRGVSKRDIYQALLKSESN